METITGRFLVRRCKSSSGEDILMIAGVAFPNFDIKQISDRDEVWAVELGVLNVIKFEHTGDGWSGGVERFLAVNPILDGTTEWKRKV